MFAPGGGGYSGAKSATVTGKLMENGEVIGTFSDHRRALMGMMPGTCSMMKRAVNLWKNAALLIAPSIVFSNRIRGGSC